MTILIVFAFLAGIVTILSPCILPVLPIVLSGSLTGGKQRPLGIVTGFVASFTFFTLFLSTIVRATGLSADALRTVSVVILLMFGASMLIPRVQIALEQLFSRLAGLLPQSQTQSGFSGGVAVGLSLGLLWTPCVGPILASVITLAATSTVTLTTFFITLAYSLGTAIPMLAITYGGRQLLQKMPALSTNTGRIQKAFGVLMILTAIGIYFNIDRTFQSYILDTFPQYGVGLTKFEDNTVIKKQLQTLQQKPLDTTKLGRPMSDLTQNYPQAPDFIPGGQWFNLPADKQALPMADLHGKVVLVDFWTYTCINCIRTLPYLKSWYAKYKDKGFVIVGVHTPEFEFEKNAANVKKAIADFGIQYPVVQDNDYATWNAYSNSFWPAEYFIDKDGKVRRTHFGEGNYDESEAFIQKLLEETGSTVDQKPNNPTYTIRARTPESYLGYRRIENLASPEPVNPDKPASYTIPTQLSPNSFAYSGTWTVTAERAMPTAGAKLAFRFDAENVYLVMRPKQGQSMVRVLLDGNPVGDNAGEDVHDGIVTVDVDRLYKLLKLTPPGEHTLQLEFLDDNLELYAFTFG